MHMQRRGRTIFDGIEVSPSNLTLPNNQCLTVTRIPATATARRNNNNSSAAAFAAVLDCTAHSVLYDAASNSFRHLTLLTNTWCSSGVEPGGAPRVRLQPGPPRRQGHHRGREAVLLFFYEFFFKIENRPQRRVVVLHEVLGRSRWSIPTS